MLSPCSPILLPNFWHDSQGSLSQDVHDTNVSISAPPIIPDIGTLEMGPCWGRDGPYLFPGSPWP